MYRSLFARDMFADFDRLQREMATLFELNPGSIRGFGRSGYPALNVGATPAAIEIHAFAPGLDPASIEVDLDKGVLSLSGERKSTLPAPDAKTTLHQQERFAGRFRRVLSLPEDIDPEGVSARYADGVLHVSVKRREATQPRRIAVH